MEIVFFLMSFDTCETYSVPARTLFNHNIKVKVGKRSVVQGSLS